MSEVTKFLRKDKKEAKKEEEEEGEEEGKQYKNYQYILRTSHIIIT